MGSGTSRPANPQASQKSSAKSSRAPALIAPAAENPPAQPSAPAAMPPLSSTQPQQQQQEQQQAQPTFHQHEQHSHHQHHHADEASSVSTAGLPPPYHEIEHEYQHTVGSGSPVPHESDSEQAHHAARTAHLRDFCNRESDLAGLTLLPARGCISVLEQYAYQIFSRMSATHVGWLTFDEFEMLMLSPTLNISVAPGEADQLFSHALRRPRTAGQGAQEQGQQGQLLSYEEFVPVMRELLLRSSESALARLQSTDPATTTLLSNAAHSVTATAPAGSRHVSQVTQLQGNSESLSSSWQWFGVHLEVPGALPAYFNTVYNVMTHDKPAAFVEPTSETQAFAQVFVPSIGKVLTTCVDEAGRALVLDWDRGQWMAMPSEWAAEAEPVTDDAAWEPDLDSDTECVKDSMERFIHPGTGVEYESIMEDGRRLFFDDDSNSWQPIPVPLELHVPAVITALKKMQGKVPARASLVEQILALRYNKYDVLATIGWFNCETDPCLYDNIPLGPASRSSTTRKGVHREDGLDDESESSDGETDYNIGEGDDDIDDGAAIQLQDPVPAVTATSEMSEGVESGVGKSASVNAIPEIVTTHTGGPASTQPNAIHGIDPNSVSSCGSRPVSARTTRVSVSAHRGASASEHSIGVSGGSVSGGGLGVGLGGEAHAHSRPGSARPTSARPGTARSPHAMSIDLTQSTSRGGQGEREGDGGVRVRGEPVSRNASHTSLASDGGKIRGSSSARPLSAVSHKGVSSMQHVFAESFAAFQKAHQALLVSEVQKAHTAGQTLIGESLVELQRSNSALVEELQRRAAAAEAALKRCESEVTEANIESAVLRQRTQVLEQQLREAAGRDSETAARAAALEEKIAGLLQEITLLHEGGNWKTIAEERAAASAVLSAKVGRATATTEALKRTVTALAETSLFELSNVRKRMEAIRAQAQEELCVNAPAMLASITAALIERTKADIVEQTRELTNKYRYEVRQRKLIYNKLQELKGNIRVFCRIRHDDRVRCVLRFPDAKGPNTPCEIQVPGEGGEAGRVFEFDRVYSPESTQQEVFEDTEPIITSCVDGYNVCIIAYGQTGSGKTFTMMGPPDNEGVNRRAVRELLRICQERRANADYCIRISLLEIYNERILDLLSGPNADAARDIRLDPITKLPFVEGRTERTVNSVDEVMQALADADENRHVAATKMNSSSSRSHLLLQLTVTSTDLISNQTSTGKLTLVDLAGSERIAKTEATGQRLVEAAAINKSLTALGQVFAALRMHQSHVPYRNSKLTHLLQDSLGGDAKTCVFVNASPAESNLSETIGTLKFGAAIRTIELDTTAAKTKKKAV
eukprot:m.196045 g.196045  ORF g.196045 m.196045 type:complete len:1328 (+) comp15460_c15_seq13:156-4139(+)